MSLFGAIIGAFLVNGIQSYLGDELQQVWMITLGVIFIAVVLFLPRGLIGLVERMLASLRTTPKLAAARRGVKEPA
jgi:urea transport system permease protein